MTAATIQQVPAVPPRPARSQEKDDSGAPVPRIPPRPISKRLERSMSPTSDRFAPSPLLAGIPPKSPSGLHFNHGAHGHSEDPIDRSGSVGMPSVGEEGIEYSAVNDELKSDRKAEQREKPRAASPEQTRTVGEDVKLHAPKPSLPAVSAKQRVMTVTRTDSEKAASFGIGRPTEERAVSRDELRKKASTTFSSTSETQAEDEQGIPEIGQRVPMNPHLGDVQAPSPAPGSEEAKKHHTRKHSSRGGPPGSYGLYSHGTPATQDKLDKAYYEKHPELLGKDHHKPIHERQNDFSMSREDLNRLVRDTASRGSGMGTSPGYHSTPTEEVGFQASEEYTSRISTPRPASSKGDKGKAPSFKSEIISPEGEQTIHVDDAKHAEYRSYGDEDNAVDDEEHEYTAPILASDEVSKDGNAYAQQPAVHHRPDRRGSANEKENPSSRPSSRPTSIYHSNASQDFGATPLEDVEEYEPLFPEEAKKEAEKVQKSDDNKDSKARHYFPSKDVWEDAPSSVHYTAEVSTPDVPEHKRRPSSGTRDRPETPAHAFAQKQEELAEREVSAHSETYLPRAEDRYKPTWAESQSSFHEPKAKETHRFPSRDVWEDAPESHFHQATVSAEPKEESKPEIPSRPRKSESPDKPAIPDRPKPKQTPSDDGQKARPPVSDKPKPQLPPRPTKGSSGDSKDGEFSKPKPPVPSRPVGGKIAALQAGFMSDLNQRLRIGPQIPKKEEPKAEDPTEEQEKAPLADARKGRARGPQRRAPARSPAAAPETTEAEKPAAPTLSFSMPQTFWAVDPERGDVAVLGESDTAPAVEEPAVSAEKSEPVKAQEPTQPAEKAESVEDSSEEEDEHAEEPAVNNSSKEAELATAEDTPSQSRPAPESEQKTLVSNTAGESILETTVEKKDGGNTMEPVDVEDTVKA
ncbi:hypothetical protein G7046_g3560 [Stylonectria norvegica]|nr:hypothetical protein G7046_g3560 [Stylonectria norvegica]